MRFELRITGFGGQGVVTAGRILALSAIRSNPNLYVVYVPSYGFATRGGEALSDVILDEEPINYPKVLQLDLLVALSQSAFNASASLVKDKGLVITDSETVQDVSKLKSNAKLVRLGISEAVRPLGSSIFTSTVVLGMLTVVIPNLIKESDLISILETNLSRKYLDKNLKAVEIGKSLGAEIL
mgnify:CR=1 FL=1